MVTITLDGVTTSLGKRRVLHALSTKFEPGSLIGIIGPNGAGKSTLIRTLLGLIKPDSGSVFIDGRELNQIPQSEVARTIAYLPQGQTLHWPLSVERLVALGRLPHLGPLSRFSEEDQARIQSAMERANVLHLRERTATELSGGERARVMLARALAVEAPALIADEPLASLDPGHQFDVMELLAREAKSGKLIITVLHDLTMAARFCDHLVLLKDGDLMSSGKPLDVLTPERLSNVYGITASVDLSHGWPTIIPQHRTQQAI